MTFSCITCHQSTRLRYAHIYTRQSQIYAREGLDLDRSTMADWVGKSTALLEPLADAIGRHVRKGQAIFADDTTIDLLVPGNKQTKTARFWVYSRDEWPWSGEAPPAFGGLRGLRPRVPANSTRSTVRLAPSV